MNKEKNIRVVTERLGNFKVNEINNIINLFKVSHERAVILEHEISYFLDYITRDVSEKNVEYFVTILNDKDFSITRSNGKLMIPDLMTSLSKMNLLKLNKLNFIDFYENLINVLLKNNIIIENNLKWCSYCEDEYQVIDDRCENCGNLND